MYKGKKNRKTRCKNLCSHSFRMTCDKSAVCLLESGEECYIKAINKYGTRTCERSPFSHVLTERRKSSHCQRKVPEYFPFTFGTGTPTSFSGMVYSRPGGLFMTAWVHGQMQRHETMHYDRVWRQCPGKRTAWSVSLPNPAGPLH